MPPHLLEAPWARADEDTLAGLLERLLHLAPHTGPVVGSDEECADVTLALDVANSADAVGKATALVEAALGEWQAILQIVEVGPAG